MKSSFWSFKSSTSDSSPQNCPPVVWPPKLQSGYKSYVAWRTATASRLKPTSWRWVSNPWKVDFGKKNTAFVEVQIEKRTKKNGTSKIVAVAFYGPNMGEKNVFLQKDFSQRHATDATILTASYSSWFEIFGIRYPPEVQHSPWKVTLPIGIPIKNPNFSSRTVGCHSPINFTPFALPMFYLHREASGKKTARCVFWVKTKCCKILR